MRKIFLALIIGILLIGCSDDKKTSEATQNAMENIAKNIENVVQNASEATADITKNIQDMTDIVTENINDSLNKTIESVSEKTEEIIENTSKKLKEVANASVATINDLQEKVSNKTMQAKEEVEVKIAQTSDIDAGKKVYLKCVACHGRNAEKLPPGGNEIIKDWKAEKIKESLLGYKEGTYGYKMKATMTSLVKTISDEDVENVAYYIESLNK